MHNASKEQREAVRQLVQSVILADMGNFTPERFKDWVKNMDTKFRRISLTLQFAINSRRVTFTVKELRSRRRVYHFAASTSVRFDDDDVIIDFEDVAAFKNW